MYTVWRFRVSALIDPATVGRVTNVFAQCGLIPHSVEVTTADERMEFEIIQPGLSQVEAQRIEGKMTALLLVRHVSGHQVLADPVTP